MVSCMTRYLCLIASYVRFHSTCGCTLIIARKKHETHDLVVSFLSNRKVWYRKIAWGEVRGSDGAFWPGNPRDIRESTNMLWDKSSLIPIV